MVRVGAKVELGVCVWRGQVEWGETERDLEKETQRDLVFPSLTESSVFVHN